MVDDDCVIAMLMTSGRLVCANRLYVSWGLCSMRVLVFAAVILFVALWVYCIS